LWYFVLGQKTDNF